MADGRLSHGIIDRAALRITNMVNREILLEKETELSLIQRAPAPHG
jgi:hypothetical protein